MLKKILYTFVFLCIAVPAGLYFAGLPPFASEPELVLGEDGEPIEPPKIPYYLTLDPPFIVNFVHRGSLRYLQLSLDLMYYDALMLERVQEQMPVIRNDLILLFSSQEFDTLSTMEGKEKLRSDVLLAVNNALDVDPANPGGAEGGAVYITNFVMQ
jgi:flagellar FliL protein